MRRYVGDSSFQIDPLPGSTRLGTSVVADNLPFYWDEQGPTNPYSLSNHLLTSPTGVHLGVSFEDQPFDFPLGRTQEFYTFFVGVDPNAAGPGNFDVIETFHWFTNSNGLGGGVSQGQNIVPLPQATGGVFGLQTGIDVNSLPADVRTSLIAGGALNVSPPATSACHLRRPRTVHPHPPRPWLPRPDGLSLGAKKATDSMTQPGNEPARVTA